MTPQEEFKELQDEVESLKKDLARSEGAEAAGLERLFEEYGCKSVKEAEALLKKLNKEKEQIKTKFDTLLQEYKDERTQQLETRSE